MGISFKNVTKNELVQNDLAPRLAEAKKTHVVTANPDIVMQTRKNSLYKQIVQQADIVSADGIGIIYAAQMMRQPLKERIPGVELVDDLLHLAEEKGYSCYFLGAEASVNERAVDQIKRGFPKLNIAGNHHGYFDLGETGIAESIAATNPDIVFVALGAPKQEMWISTYKELFNKGLFIGVGGSFDVYAGAVKRAPSIWIKLNLEWLHRIIVQPTRLKRIWSSVWFMILVAFGRGKK